MTDDPKGRAPRRLVMLSQSRSRHRARLASSAGYALSSAGRFGITCRQEDESHHRGNCRDDRRRKPPGPGTVRAVQIP